MVRVASAWVLVAGLAALGALPPQTAGGAIGQREARQLAEVAVGTQRALADRADLMLRFIQEDGPESGHVRVVLTPETRPLTMLEARSAAQQAFLEALNEPGLSANLTRITVVVRLMPASHPNAAETTIVFQHKGGRDWSILSGE